MIPPVGAAVLHRIGQQTPLRRLPRVECGGAVPNPGVGIDQQP